MGFEVITELNDALVRYLSFSFFQNRSLSSKQFALVLRKSSSEAISSKDMVVVIRIVISLSYFVEKKINDDKKSRLKELIVDGGYIEKLLKLIIDQHSYIEFLVLANLGIKISMLDDQGDRVVKYIRIAQNTTAQPIEIGDSVTINQKQLTWQEHVYNPEHHSILSSEIVDAIRKLINVVIQAFERQTLDDKMATYQHFLSRLSFLLSIPARSIVETVYNALKSHVIDCMHTLMKNFIKYLYGAVKSSSGEEEKYKNFSYLKSVYRKLFVQGTTFKLSDDLSESKQDEFYRVMMAEFYEFQFDLRQGRQTHHEFDRFAIRNGYYPLGFLGSGAFGTVNKVVGYRDVFNGEESRVVTYALKRPLMREDVLSGKFYKVAKAAKSFKNEVDILSKIRPHENIISIFKHSDTSGENHVDFLVMPLAIGDLNHYRSKCSLEILDYYNICLGMLRAIIYLHKERIAHQDLSEYNVLVYDGARIKLNDFGFAKSFKGMDDSQVQEVEYGWAATTPPEKAKFFFQRNIIKANVTFPDVIKADCFSVSVLIFYALVGWNHHVEAKRFPFVDKNTLALNTYKLICDDPCPQFQEVSVGNKPITPGLHILDEVRRSLGHPSPGKRGSLEEAEKRIADELASLNISPS